MKKETDREVFARLYAEFERAGMRPDDATVAAIVCDRERKAAVAEWRAHVVSTDDPYAPERGEPEET